MKWEKNRLDIDFIPCTHVYTHRHKLHIVLGIKQANTFVSII